MYYARPFIQFLMKWENIEFIFWEAPSWSCPMYYVWVVNKIRKQRDRAREKERWKEAEHTCKETADGLGTQRRTNCSIFHSLNTNSHLLPWSLSKKSNRRKAAHHPFIIIRKTHFFCLLYLFRGENRHKSENKNYRLNNQPCKVSFKEWLLKAIFQRPK